MARYIDIEPFENQAGLTSCCVQTITESGDTATLTTTNTKDIPTIEPESLRPHGRWDNSERYRFVNGDIAIRCSECGCALHLGEYLKYNWNYCPNCGAKMDEEENDA